MFLNQKSKFGQFLEGLAMEDVGIFYGHLVFYTAIWFSLQPFGVLHRHLVYFGEIWYILSRFGMLCQ
jgi:hypothetical protein